ncbi:hypothetical protein G6F46_010283 [Rhizopus delemar]|nr:hypothetical protein G6F55_009340 [Rhizopus delemar]KAG1537489.1 hypothetical protein G6F51_010342 [Rhizopus arrhizus]KAG1491715.1 hypothetical protein G6F54_009816 [Rhizopus delemar]KAG1505969.1 hypothetical protein G6F53_010027 [Rhizopus delemar]KAG1520963.1 hypothetical protein G6F52_007174 [Rhizopus delemar]
MEKVERFARNDNFMIVSGQGLGTDVKVTSSVVSFYNLLIKYTNDICLLSKIQMYSTVIESICSLTEHYLRTMVNESRKDEDNRTIASMNVSFILDNVVPRVSSQLNHHFNRPIPELDTLRAKLRGEIDISQPKRPLTNQERIKIYYECLHTIQDIQSWAEGWFYYPHDRSHPPFKEIKRDNLALWFAWAFWHERLEIVQQNRAWATEIEWMLTTAEDHFQVKFPSGYNPVLRCIRLNFDPVQATHRPLAVYVAIYLATLVFNSLFLQWIWGLRYTDVDEQHPVGYWSGHTTSPEVPLVFIHGVGVGLLGYVDFLHQLLTQSGRRPVFLVELPYVSMRLVDHVPSATETVKAIEGMLNRFGYTKAVFVSHSLGTGVASWVSRFAPHLIAGSVMVDPICFLLHYHHVAFNFIHRLPKVLIEYILCYGVSRELYISHFISRHLQWFETIHFGDGLNDATVFLSENDRIIGTHLVYNYLKEHGIDVHIMPSLEHAQFLFDAKWKATILEHIDKTSRKADLKNKT